MLNEGMSVRSVQDRRMWPLERDGKREGLETEVGRFAVINARIPEEE
jgi:hypothetical protein